MKTYLPLLNKKETSLGSIVNGLSMERYDPVGDQYITKCGYPIEEFFTYPPESPIRIALVIGTYASLPYVHLGLESWKRNYHHVPVMVHDDCSPQKEKLKKLCQEYGAYFGTNTANLGHTPGDVSAFYHGLQWAKEREDVNILVKFSRRFLPLYDWTNRLTLLARETQYPTFCNICENLNWGFRSECFAVHIPTWERADVSDIIRKEILWKREMFVENFTHELAKSVHRFTSPSNIHYVLEHPKEDWRSAYADWDILGTNRIKPVDGLLWHHSCSPSEYYAVSAAWGLPYTRLDFGLPEGAHD